MTARQGDAARLVGTWRLVSIAGDRLRPYRGQRPQGMLVYDATGHMAVQITPDRPRAAYAGRLPTSSEAMDALLGYTAYFGTYEVNEHERTVTHHREGNINPGKVDSVVRRYEFLADDGIVLRPRESGSAYTWRRVK